MKNIPRIMLAAPRSGSGKTLITCSLLSAQKKRGIKVCSVKTGPDYIDPMFHRSVLDIPSDNLDTFFTDEQTTRSLFLESTEGFELAVTEGVMGLFDGALGMYDEGTSYHLAKTLNTPIILVVDTKGAYLSIIPVIKGFLSYDRENLIKGVILNNMSKMLLKKITPILEREIPVPILGCFERNPSLVFESRHLGLKLPEERKDIRETLSRAGEILEESIDVNRILKIAGSAPEISEKPYLSLLSKDYPPKKERIKIAVARDEAFCFYYDINFKMLRHFGLEPVEFSPIHDSSLPEDIQGIILGGGYPELWAKELSRNTPMLESIREAIHSGLPTLAECGGFMYLHKNLINDNKESFPLLGIIEGDVEYTGKLVRFGYALFKDRDNIFTESLPIKGHEFHYYESSNNGSDVIATKPEAGRSWECNFVTTGNWWGFSHLYYPSNPEFVEKFSEYCFFPENNI